MNVERTYLLFPKLRLSYLMNTRIAPTERSFWQSGAGNARRFSTIHPHHAAYLPLAYPLLFPHGDHGFHWGLRVQDRQSQGRKNHSVEWRQYCRYILHQRDAQLHVPFSFSRLFQQFLVEMWAVDDQLKLECPTCIRVCRIGCEMVMGMALHWDSEPFSPQLMLVANGSLPNAIKIRWQLSVFWARLPSSSLLLQTLTGLRFYENYALARKRVTDLISLAVSSISSATRSFQNSKQDCSAPLRVMFGQSSIRSADCLIATSWFFSLQRRLL